MRISMRNAPFAQVVVRQAVRFWTAVLHSPGVRIIVWLSLCGIVLVTVGLVIFPWVPWPPVPEPMQVEVNDSNALTAVDVSVENATSSTFQIKLRIESVRNIDAGDGQPPMLKIRVSLPKNDTVVDASSGIHASGLNSSVVSLDGFEFHRGTSDVAFATLDAEGQLYGVSTDGPDTIVALPQIVVDGDGARTAVANLPNSTENVTLPIPDHAQLAWLEMRPDQEFGASDFWSYPLTSKATPTATASNITLANERSFRGFLSGGLFALGGSALIALLPEAIREHAKRKKARLRASASGAGQSGSG
jgi:hypothetical protein